MSNSKVDILKTHKKLPDSLKTVNSTANTAKSTADEAKTKAEQAFQAGSETKQKLVDKLTSVGVEASTNETFDQLIGKIENITPQYAIVDINKEISMRGDRDYITTHISYSLEFIPSRLIVLMNISEAKNVSLDTKYVSSTNVLHSTSFGSMGPNAMDSYFPKGDMYITNITQNGFDFISKVYANYSKEWYRSVTILKVEALK